jgi:hypothetical protein
MKMYPRRVATYYYAIFLETGRGSNLVRLMPHATSWALHSIRPVRIYPRNKTKTLICKSGRTIVPQFESNEVDSSEASDEEEGPRAGREPSERGINNVIRRTFLAGDFAGAVRDLKPFFRNSAPKVRAKAMFYTGMSRFRLGQYERAMRYFEHPLTRKYYRRNAEFWINRTQENLR